MINYLRKYKINKLLSTKIQSYILVQILPVKSSIFIEWVKMLSLFNITVKSLKSKQTGGILSSTYNKKYNSIFKNLFKGFLVMLQPTNFLFFENFFEFTKKNKNLNIIKIIKICAFFEGFFYNLDFIKKSLFLKKNFLVLNLKMPFFFIKKIVCIYTNLLFILKFKKNNGKTNI